MPNYFLFFAKVFLVLNFGIALSSYLKAQVGIGTATPNLLSILELSSTNKGFLPPRLDRTVLTVATGEAGMIVYDTNDNKPFFWNGGAWESMATTSTSAYIQNQTATDQTAGFRVTGNGLFNGGKVGIGTISPVSLFSIGAGSEFQVGTNGDLVKINNVPYSWPSTNTAGLLVNNGSGTLSWTNLSSLGLVSASNGLTATAGDVKLGGSLTQATVITQGAHNLAFNLTGAGGFGVQNSGNDVFIVNPTGSVGIGSGTITSKLHVRSSVAENSYVQTSIENFASGQDAGLNLKTVATNEDATIFLDESDSRKLKFSLGNVSNDANMNTNTKLTIQQDSRVGIGISAPTDYLHINDPNNSQGSIRITAGTTSGVSSADGISLNINNAGASLLSYENLPFFFGTGGVNQMTLNSTGLGIGVSPSMAFDVNGNSLIRGSLSMNTSNKIINLANPTNAQDAATKFYVDNAASGTNFIQNQSAIDQTASLRINGNGLFNGGSVAVGTSNVEPTAILEVKSTTKGVLFPRLTTAQRNAITTPADFLHIFNTDNKRLEFFDPDYLSWRGYGIIAGTTMNLTIAANTSNYNIFSAAGNPTVPVEVILTINSGVTVNAAVAGGAAITSGALPDGSVVKIINNGNIRGGGGNGGNGQYFSTLCTLIPVGLTPGGNGGHAIVTTVPISITNNGVIAAGGGGGGGAGANGSGGGGGAGSPPGAGGTVGGGCGCTNGNPGALLTGGLGGGACSFGGNGGNAGANGVIGTNGGSIGGLAGYRVKHNGNSVVFVVTGTTFGTDGP